MSKICWKCGRHHEEGAAFCPFCGAAFASDDAKYKTDGRTLTLDADKTYPSASYNHKRKSKAPALMIGAIVILAIMALFFFSSASDVKNGTESDSGIEESNYEYRYNYHSLVEDDPDFPSNKLWMMTLAIKNVNGIEIPSDNFSFSVYAGDKIIEPLKMKCISKSYALYGEYLYYNLTFRVPNELIDDAVIKCKSIMPMKGEYDSSIDL